MKEGAGEYPDEYRHAENAGHRDVIGQVQLCIPTTGPVTYDA
jgi:hypothetical protein